MRGWSVSALAVLIGALLVVPATGDDLEEGMAWEKVTSRGLSLVFGRMEGKFEGPDFKNRKIELRRVENGKRYKISVGEGLGYFETLLPPGAYRVTGLEATYYPPSRPLNPKRFRPVSQRFGVRPKGTDKFAPAFYVYADRPVYIGTIQVDNARDGIVYRGHYLRVLDEFEEAFERLTSNYPDLTAGLARLEVEPKRHFMLKPAIRQSPLELVEIDDPIRRARDYITEGRYQQAVNWLQTFMPASDVERSEAKLLIGEALLARGKYDEAIEKLGDVLQADPENHRALRLLARSHAFKDDFEDAFDLYRGLAEAMPGDPEAHLQLGYLYALRDEPSLSAEEFSSAFEFDLDYLMHDIGPFTHVLKAIRDNSADYVPPKVLRTSARPPRSMRSRRGGQEGLALLIDHKGKVVAARVSPGSETLPIIMISMIRATFKPAALNGVPVPALLLMGGGGWGSSSAR